MTALSSRRRLALLPAAAALALLAAACGPVPPDALYHRAVADLHAGRTARW